MPNSTVLVTGSAGFIGFHVSKRLLDAGYAVHGSDSINDYYDQELKKARLSVLTQHRDFNFSKIDLSDQDKTLTFFQSHRFSHVIHLAAQAGVRYSITNPQAYVDANLQGFINVLEGCRHNGCEHLLFASSSSVYGANRRLPFRTSDCVDHPLSLYGATKKANELMSHSYSHLFQLPTTGLRFFTVYGPWGRPDMAMWIFADAILAGKPIQLFNNGEMLRDFTYIDDVVESIIRLIKQKPAGDPSWSPDNPTPGSSAAPWRIYNIGNSNPVQLLHVIKMLEKNLGREAVYEMLPMQPGDVPATFADVDDLSRDVGFSPSTSIEDGVARFVSWYKEYRRGAFL